MLHHLTLNVIIVFLHQLYSHKRHKLGATVILIVKSSLSTNMKEVYFGMYQTKAFTLVANQAIFKERRKSKERRKHQLCYFCQRKQLWAWGFNSLGGVFKPQFHGIELDIFQFQFHGMELGSSQEPKTIYWPPISRMASIP